MFCKRRKYTKRELELEEFDVNGVWGWTYPLVEGAPYKPRKTPLASLSPRKITRAQEFRSETNRIKALKKLEACVDWKTKHHRWCPGKE